MANNLYVIWDLKKKKPIGNRKNPSKQEFSIFPSPDYLWVLKDEMYHDRLSKHNLKESKSMIVEKIAKEILALQVVRKSDPEPEIEPETEQTTTSIPQDEIDAAVEIATFVRDKANSLLTESNQAIENLSGKGKASVLESKDDFKSLLLRLKQMKRKIQVV